jgi:hypothetical protein
MMNAATATPAEAISATVEMENTFLFLDPKSRWRMSKTPLSL